MSTQSADKDSESVDMATVDTNTASASNEDPTPTQTADGGSDSVDMETTQANSESVDMETTASADESADGSESASSNDDEFTTTDDNSSEDTTEAPVDPDMPTTSMMSNCVFPPNADTSECECFAGPFVDSCPLRCELINVNTEPACVDGNSASNSFVADSADVAPTDAPIVTIQVDEKSGSGSSSSDDSGDNVAFIGKQSEQKNDMAEATQSGTTMALIGLLSAAALLLCVSAIGGALYCRMKGKGYVDMSGMDIEMNGIMSVREGMAESGFSHIAECKDSDEEVEITIEEENDTLIYGQ